MLDAAVLAFVLLLAAIPLAGVFLAVRSGVRALRRGEVLAGASALIGVPGCWALAWLDLPIGPVVGLGLAVAALWIGLRAQRRPSPAAVAGLALNVFALFWWALVAPPWITPRVGANEAGAVGDLRSISSAEVVFSTLNGDLYGEADCLNDLRAKGCLPAPPASNVPLLSSELAAHKSGYLRRFHPGLRPDAREIEAAKASPRSLKTWAVTAVPERPGETGNRGFCIDQSGAICATLDGREPPLTPQGACAIVENAPDPRAFWLRVRRALGSLPPPQCVPVR
jgi:hypothetical protein